MQFAPDYRNLGGRYLILTQLHNHRLSLRSIQERESNLHSPQIQQKRKRKNKAEDPLSFRHGAQNIQTGCLTDRTQRKPYFFRRQPQNEKSYQQLLYKPPLNYPKTSSYSHAQKSEQNIFSKSLQQQVSWPEIVSEFNQLGDKIYKIDLKKYFYKVALHYQIYTEQDYALLIRILLQIFPDLKQETLVDIFADIIQELEN